MNWEYGDSETLMGSLCGSQIANGSLEPNGLHLQLADQRVLIIVCLPNECLGLALIKPEGVVH